MDIRLHANATTTPKVRGYIQASPAPVALLARELGVSETTIRRWRGRRSQGDPQPCPARSRPVHRFRTGGHHRRPAHRCAGLGLDDITEVMNRCLAPGLSRSAIWRCLRRQGLGGRLSAAVAPPTGRFDPSPFGYVHVDLKYLGKLRSIPEFAFVATPRVTRFAHVEIIPDRRADTVRAAMQRFPVAFGHPVHTVLTPSRRLRANACRAMDNGAEFTDRFRDGSRAGHAARPSGRHPFDRLCAAAGITHRPTRPYRPQTDGMAERFNRRLSAAMHALPQARDNSRHQTRFTSHAERANFLLTFVADYNRTRLRCLNYHAPLDVLNNQTEDNTPGRAHLILGLLKPRQEWCHHKALTNTRRAPARGRALPSVCARRSGCSPHRRNSKRPTTRALASRQPTAGSRQEDRHCRRTGTIACL